MTQQLTIQTFLETEFNDRRTRNARYSLRAFARDLNMQVSQLSELLSGRGGLSVSKAKQIVGKVCWEPLRKDIFVTLAQLASSRLEKDRASAQHTLDELQKRFHSLTPLTDDAFRALSEWYHLAILELPRLTDFEPSVEYAASKLGVEPELIRTALDRLQRLGLLKVTETGWQPSDNAFQTENHQESTKLFHRQFLNLARHAAALSRKGNGFDSVIFSFPSERYAEMRAKLHDACMKIVFEYGKLPGADRVYGMGMQLFEIDGRVN